MISYWLLILPHRLTDWMMFHYYCYHHGLPGSVHLPPGCSSCRADPDLSQPLWSSHK